LIKKGEAIKRQRVVFLAGEKIDLGILEKEQDIGRCLRWVNDQKITKFLLIGVLPTNKNLEEEWFEKQGKDKDNIVFAILTKEGEMIGVAGLHKIDWLTGLAEAGILIGEKQHHSKGYGTEAEKLLLFYAKEYLNLRKITGRIFEENYASRKAAEKNGFEKEGFFKEHLFRRGKFHNIIFYSKFI